MNVLMVLGRKAKIMLYGNAGVAISISKGISLSEGFEAAKESLKSVKH
ncbi:MAG: hypothetical protein CM15mP102_19140 [Flavobacteriales bacterium]|nr:MAG: hypothetical protein CM15mP102_19140 [Flavobacteriales bacterium]